MLSDAATRPAAAVWVVELVICSIEPGTRTRFQNLLPGSKSG